MTPETLTEALARFPTGVLLLSVQDASEWGDSDDVATTVTAFMPVSLDPPLVATAVTTTSYVCEVLRRRDVWGVSVLATGQIALAGRFAAPGRPSPRLLLADTPHHRGDHTGSLLLDGACAALECRTTSRQDQGDHLLLVAEVVAVAHVAAEREPLVRFGRAYRGLSPRLPR